MECKNEMKITSIRCIKTCSEKSGTWQWSLLPKGFPRDELIVRASSRARKRQSEHMTYVIEIHKTRKCNNLICEEMFIGGQQENFRRGK